MADIKCLEHPTLKVPYELLNKKFRLAQKNIDREVSHVQNAASELEKLIQKGMATVGDITTALTGLEEKLTMLKRKSNESIEDETEAAKACKRRLEHLKECENTSEATQQQWKRKRLDRMLVEYFLRAGYYETAVNLAKQSDIEDLTNIELFLVSKEVEDSLRVRETSKCLAWCYDNKSKLRKMKSTLEFNLRQQEFIELVRSDKRLEAIKYSRKYFSNMESLEESQLADVQRVMGLLAFPADTQIQFYKELLDPGRWQCLVQQFRQENFKLYQLTNHSVFTVALQAGLSALKTPHCYKSDSSGKNADCPVCSKHMNVLAKGLPFAHCSNSRLICSISGQSLNEHNPPLMLPNGHVYGNNSLKDMADMNEGRVVCPRTRQIFTIDDAEKVFVM